MDMAFHPSFGLLHSPGYGPAIGERRGDSLGNSGDALRLLGWAELCARLVARQDFRTARAALGLGRETHASFHGSAARWLAMLQAPALDRAGLLAVQNTTAADQDIENEVFINPTPSAVGKSMSGIASPAGGAISTALAHRAETEMSA